MPDEARKHGQAKWLPNSLARTPVLQNHLKLKSGWRPHTNLSVRMDSHSVRFLSAFVPFFFSIKKYPFFHNFICPIYALTRLLHSETKFFRNVFLQSDTAVF